MKRIVLLFVFMLMCLSLSAQSGKDILAAEQPASVNPFAGFDLPESVTLREEPVIFRGPRRYKVLQVVGGHAALAQSSLNRTGSRYGDPVVLLYCDEAGVLYDDLVIYVGQRKKTLQVGTYTYKSMVGLWKTVPIVMVMDKD